MRSLNWIRIVRRLFSLISGFSFFITLSAFAWDGHLLLTYISLKNAPEIGQKPTIPTETLTTFLQKERSGLVKLLRENETWSQRHIAFYLPLPQNLAFKGDQSKPLARQFIEAIRVNPNLDFPLFVQYPPRVAHKIHDHPLARMAVMLPDVAKAGWVYVPNPPLEGVSPGKKVSPLEIIATASEEPDYGMDINLWQNNPSEFGKQYQWGPQPFGPPTLLLGSQAPFHMGFYYESRLLYKAAPPLKHSYLEYRVHLFIILSRYAFQTGHPYWGYRFLGWALHYAQDLTQPYHSTAAPNTSLLKIIAVNLLDRLGYHSSQNNLIQLVCNRHYTLEDYTYHLLKHKLEMNQENDPVIQALADQRQDAQYPTYTNSYPREIIAKESHAVADPIDKIIRKTFPKKYVADPNYIFYETEPVVDLFVLMKDQYPKQNMEPFNKQLAKLLRAFGAHTRNMVRYVLKGET